NHNKLGFIDGTYKRDNKNHALANQKEMCNSVAVNWIVNSLNGSYLAIRSNILTREPLPLVKAAFAVVSGEESHRNATSSRATSLLQLLLQLKLLTIKRRFNNKTILTRCFKLVGTQVLISKIGDLKINNDITLYDVLLIPEYTVSLLQTGMWGLIFNAMAFTCLILGHPAYQVINALKYTLNLDSHSVSDHLCDTCNKAKQTREHFH
ncbi:hypothetical protein Tco_0920588, partial [Tanacetum coccineum]